MHAVVQHTNTQEHRSRNKTVRDHLNNGTLNTSGIKNKQAERDKTHVRDGGISHQLFHVILNQRDQTNIDHRNQ